LVIEQPEPQSAAAEVKAWAKELEAATAHPPSDEDDHFRKALDEIEKDSKDAVRREWRLL
jgi:hypothetical protein